MAGGNTFNHNKPDPKHLTDTIEIIGGNLKKSIMIGDSETDSHNIHTCISCTGGWQYSQHASIQ